MTAMTNTLNARFRLDWPGFTLDVDLAQFGRLAPMLGDEIVKVAESGILTPADAALVHSQGADVVLVGEALVRDGDPTAAIRAMVDATR